MNTELWNRIKAFQVHTENEVYEFTTHLAVENKWTINYTKGAIEEYKKFMYLAATTDHTVLPSGVVTHVWHAHMLNKESYNQFGLILGKKVERIPSSYISDNKEVFKKVNERTLALYEQIFGERPEDYWLFTNAWETLRMKKSKWRISVISLIGIVLMSILPAFLILKSLFHTIDNSIFLSFYIFSSVILFVGLDFLNRKKMKEFLNVRVSNKILNELSPNELIYLKHKKIDKVVYASVNHLIRRNVLRILPANLKLVKFNKLDESNSFSKEVCDKIVEKEEISFRELSVELRNSLTLKQIEISMNELEKHFIRSRFFVRLFMQNFVAIALLTILGLSSFITDIEIGGSFYLNLFVTGSLLFASILFLVKLSGLFTKKVIIDTYKEEKIPNKSYKQNYGHWEFEYLLHGEAYIDHSFSALAG